MTAISPEKIEAAARAICIAQGYDPRTLDDIGSYSHLPLWKDKLGSAEAALSAALAVEAGTWAIANAEPWHVENWHASSYTTVGIAKDGVVKAVAVSVGDNDEGDYIVAALNAYASPTLAPAGDDIESYFERQIDWSRQTFGPALRTRGITHHIRKELREVEANPRNLSEWVDVVILAMDGFWRHGGDAADLLPALLEKQKKNMARTWPDWWTMSEHVAIEHDRSHEARSIPAVDLHALIATLERAEAGGPELDEAIVNAAAPVPPGIVPGTPRRVTTNLAEAVAFAEWALPGCFYLMAKGKTRHDEPPFAAQVLFGTDEVLGEAETSASLAMALVIATLKAIAGRQEA